jgi:DNA gyrase subunit A
MGDIEDAKFLVMVTQQGTIKKTSLDEFENVRHSGLIAINLRDGDELVRVVETKPGDDCFAVTSKGMTIRFAASDVREMGRAAAGVRGIKLKEDDEVVSLDVASDEADILIVTDAGYGKRTKLERFNRQGRGGQGVRGIKLTAARGRVVAAFIVSLEEEILLISSGGVIIRTAVKEISSQGRDATGVRVMNLDDGQSVAAVTRVAEEAPTEELS